MADNIAVTAGSGTTVSTEEVTTLNGGAVSAQHVQRVGAALITANGTVLDVTSSNPMPVSLAAGTNAIGKLAANTGVTIGAVEIAATQTLGTVTTVSTVTNLSQFGGAAINLGAGTVGTGTLRTTQASDSPLVAATGAIGDAAWASGNGTVISLLKTVANASLDTTTASPVKLAQDEYETVAASATDQVLGATGASGDYLAGLLIVPATAAAGAVSIKDGTGSAITVFAGGGTTALPTLAPIPVPLGIKCTGAGWKVTTGANVSVIAAGDFT